MSTPTESKEPIAEIVAGKILGELTAEEDQRLGGHSEEELRQEFETLEQAAAAVALMFSPSESQSMPNDLRDLIQQQGISQVRGRDLRVVPGPQRSTQRSTQSPTSGEPTFDESTHGSVTHQEKSKLRSPASQELDLESSGRRDWLGWLVAAAASVLAMGLWIGGQKGAQTVQLSVQREDLISTASDLVQVEWGEGTTPFPEEVSGDVVWSNEKQKGFMRFVSMPVNDASVEQYQLWIIDPERDDEPIDGGVFDVSSEGEVIVPIDAKLRVLKPAAFAITIEKPGGVVVSTQERLPLLASVN